MDTRRGIQLDLHKEYTLKELPDLLQPVHLEWVCAGALCLLCIYPLGCRFLQDGWLFAYTAYLKVAGILGYVLFQIGWMLQKRGNAAFQAVPFRLNKTVLFLGGLLVWSGISTILAPNPTLAFFGTEERRDGLLAYICYGGVLLLALQLRSAKIRRLVLKVMTGVGAVCALICRLKFQPLLDYLQMSPERGFFFNLNHYGYFLNLTLVLTLGLFATSKNRRPWATAAWLVVIGLLANGLANCRSLGPLLGTMGGAVGLVIFMGVVDKPAQKRVLIGIGTALCLFCLSCIGIWDLQQEISRFFTDVSLTMNAALGKIQPNTNAAGSSRLGLWRQAVQFTLEKPFFGYGPDSLGLRYALESHYYNDRPHNVILQLSASLGIPAAVLYLTAMGCLLAQFIKQFQRLTTENILLYCGIGAYLITSLTGNSMFYTTPFYFLTLGLCCISMEHPRS